jgi:hypothetical protein
VLRSLLGLALAFAAGFSLLYRVASETPSLVDLYNLPMIPPAFYLETSVWGSLAPRQPRDRAQTVRRLLRLLDGVRGTCAISEVVLAEIDLAPPEEADLIRHHIDVAEPVVHAISAAMALLARAYIEAGCFRRLARQMPCMWRQLPASNSIT